MKREYWVILGGIAVFLGIIVVAQIAQDGNFSGVTAGVSQISQVVSSTFETFPDHPTTQQLLDWNEKCRANQASADVCVRVNSVMVARMKVCNSRMGLRDFLSLGPKATPIELLRYCDQRFPDMR